MVVLEVHPVRVMLPLMGCPNGHHHLENKFLELPRMVISFGDHIRIPMESPGKIVMLMFAMGSGIMATTGMLLLPSIPTLLGALDLETILR